MYHRHTTQQYTQKGFSLVELLVSLSIFAIIMVASTGTLLTLIDVNAKGQALYTATTNLSFALDSMTREMRMGYHYDCFSSNSLNSQALPVTVAYISCTDNAVTFFRERDDWQVGYRYNATDKTIEQKTKDTLDVSTSWVPLTSADEVDIDDFTVTVENSDYYCHDATCSLRGDDEQPIVVMRIKGHVTNGLATDTEFDIQTQITQRKLDLKE